MKFQVTKLMTSGRKRGKVFKVKRNFPTQEEALAYLQEVNNSPKANYRVLHICEFVQKEYRNG